MNKKIEKVFENDLSQIDNIYLVFSSEEYLLDKFENKFKEKFVDKEIEDFNLTYIKEEDNVFKNIVNKGSTLPVMSQKRFIIVKAGNIFKKSIPNFDAFEKFLKDIPDSTVILILVNDDLSNNKRKDIIKEQGEVINYSPPRFQDINKWIKLQFRDRGKKINYRGIRLLEKMFNNNLQQLDSEIDKICTYIDEKNKVEVSDIKAVMSKDRRLKENTIFEFLDAISKKEKNKSLYYFHQLLENGEVPQIIFAMITRRVRLMLITKDLKQQGIKHKKIANKLGVHPYPIKKIYGYVDNYSAEELEKMLDKFLEADVKLKTGEDKIENSIQNAIISI
ncbi:MAG: DNA polymerase III subunit delta [Halanaerobiales bacterium]|nr:DNA polymerase III subunit delta [Halanaerobiales bacterium]